MDKKTVGFLGEKFSQDILKEKGFEVIKTNYHSRYGEIDVIAKNKEFLLFVEVKTRAEGSLGSPAEAVNIKKQRKLIKTAVEYMSKNPTELQPRFDVIEIVVKKSDDFSVKEYNHIENAFWAEDIYEIF